MFIQSATSLSCHQARLFEFSGISQLVGSMDQKCPEAGKILRHTKSTPMVEM